MNFSIISAFSAANSALGFGGKDFCSLIGLALGTFTTGGLWLTFLTFLLFFLSFLLAFLVRDLSDFTEYTASVVNLLLRDKNWGN